LNERKNVSTILLTILVIIILFGASYYVFFYGKNESKEKVEEEKKIDDRISPLETQSVAMEIHRIRKKGIIDVMMNSGSKILDKLPIRKIDVYNALDGIRPGIGWRKLPTFRYALTLDGLEWKSKEYKTWDTDYIDIDLFKNVEEEQTTAKIDFKIIQKDKKLLKTYENIMESFSLDYDFKTGRWSGDDYFNDSDGYGHYNGSNYEIWFTARQADYDGDGIPYWTEVNVLGTNSMVDDSTLDSDDDGCSNAWEWFWGYDPFKWDNHSYLDPDDDGLQNTEEYFMDKWTANPFTPDIYIEADYMEKAPFRPYKIEMGRGRILPITRPRLVKTNDDGSKHIFYEESQQMIIERFSEHGITVHIDDGCMGGGGDEIPYVPSGNYGQYGIFSEYYKHKFADNRKGVFRYVVTAHGGGWCHPQDFRNYYDVIVVPCNFKFNVNQLSVAISPRVQRIGRAVEIIHELGHSCGFTGDYSDGVDNSSAKAGNPPDYPWLDYKSVMNYDYFGQRFFDYSDGTNGEYDKDDWSNLDIGFFQRPSPYMEGFGH